MLPIEGDQLQLRCYVPNVDSRHITTPEGLVPMNFRNELILEAHNKRGHPGRQAG